MKGLKSLKLPVCGMVLSGLALLLSAQPLFFDAWKNLPALAKPDGTSQRGDKMIAAEISDPRVLAELSRRFRELRPFHDRAHFELQQEYFLRLLDYYCFSKSRLIGKTLPEIEAIFGPLDSPNTLSTPQKDFVNYLTISAGRDLLQVWFKNSRCFDANYVMGF